MSFACRTCPVVVALACGCASTPPHFYTLVHEAERDPSAASEAELPVKVGRVRIPAQVDRLELVTRLPDGSIAIVEGEQWIAPLADELQQALSVELTDRLRDAEPARTPGVRAESVLVRMEVERFESAPSRYALIDASWHLELEAERMHVTVACRTQAYEPVNGGYPQLVRGHQRAVAVIADQIASVAGEVAAGGAVRCPPESQH